MNLGIFIFRGLGLAYEAIQQAPNLEDIQFLDLLPTNEGALILSKGPMEALQRFQATLPQSHILKHTLLQDCPEGLLQAFYSLNEPKLSTGAVIFESLDLLVLFEMGRSYVTKGLQIFEFRFFRSSQQKSYLILTGEVAPLEKELTSLREEGLFVKAFSNLNEPLRSLIEGHQII